MHTFTYSLFPHDNAFGVETIRQAYDLNNPVRLIKGTARVGKHVDKLSLVSVDKENIVVETLKQAENGEDVIIRLYESINALTNVNIKFGFNVYGVEICDLMENKISSVDVSKNCVLLTVKPFEIVTLKLKIKE